MTQDEIIEMAMKCGIEEAYSLTHNQYLVRFKDGSLESFAKLVAAKKRNDTLEEVAQEFDKMKVFGDTAASFAIFVRGMKR